MSDLTLELTDANFAATVEDADVPVLVDFWAPWCGPCKHLSPVVEKVAELYAGRLRVAKLNTDDNPAVASRFNIRSIPTLLFFRGGQVVDSVVGAVPESKLTEKVDAVLGG